MSRTFSIFMMLKEVRHVYDMIIDDVSLKRIPGICGANLLRNGDFESYGKFWRSYGTNQKYDIEQTSTSKTLKIFNKNNPDHGVYQDLYLDKDCLEEKQRFKILGAFICLKKALNVFSRLITLSYFHFVLQANSELNVHQMILHMNAIVKPAAESLNVVMVICMQK